MHDSKHGSSNLFEERLSDFLGNDLSSQNHFENEVVDVEDEDFGGIWHIPINANEENILAN